MIFIVLSLTSLGKTFYVHQFPKKENGTKNCKSKFILSFRSEFDMLLGQNVS